MVEKESRRTSDDRLLGAGILVVGGLTAAAFLSGSLVALTGQDIWFLTMLRHFHAHFTVAAVLVMVVAIFRKRLHWMALAIALIVLNVMPVIPHVTQALADKNRADDAIEYYVHDLGGPGRTRFDVAELLQSSRPELAVLFGISETSRDAFEPLRQAYGVHLAAPVRGGDEAAYETLLLSRLPISDVRVIRSGAPGLPFAVLARVQKQGCHLYVAALRLERGFSAERLQLRRAQMEKLVEVLNTIDGPLVVMGGHGLSPWTPPFQRYKEQAGLDHTGGGFRATWPAWAGDAGLPFHHVLTRGGANAASSRGPALGTNQKSIYGWAGVPDRGDCRP